MISNNNTIIKIEDLFLSFGGVEALKGINIEAKDKEILAIIGPNGAGKTCILNCINGFYKPQKGHIYMEGINITGLRPDKIANLRIARTFQNIELYSGLSTLDNLMAARHILMNQNLLSSSLYFGWAQKLNTAKQLKILLTFWRSNLLEKRLLEHYLTA
jgi:branched-chain amino acid transport system ATP-binding protein